VWVQRQVPEPLRRRGGKGKASLYLSGFLKGLCMPVLGHRAKLSTKGFNSSDDVKGALMKDSPLRGSMTSSYFLVDVHFPPTVAALGMIA
jgi:hypothetical protein